MTKKRQLNIKSIKIGWIILCKFKLHFHKSYCISINLSLSLSPPGLDSVDPTRGRLALYTMSNLALKQINQIIQNFMLTDNPTIHFELH